MSPRKPCILTIAAAALAAILWTSIGPAPALAAPGEAPRLILLVAVDQMRHDYLPRFADAFTGGSGGTGPSSRTRTSTTTRRSPR